ncbi:hypothetical protein DEJ50_33085 [Streptomyces venezuelae]|uniref:Uncharacterized protein n=1 Tax=Streptomyces venezuelae TaxID=54571 RepID=A0A5P2DG34_STRVZ|nr:hypothetical protein DEJ50_33085 [Streptomyces venezuelae]
MLAPGLQAGLEHRGLLKEWEPVPPDAPRAGQILGGTGRVRGGADRPAGCRAARGAVAVADAGGYWTNQPHVQALQAWTDQWGPGPAAGRSAAPPEAIAERAQSTAQVVTTGGVVRAALERVLRM